MYTAFDFLASSSQSYTESQRKSERKRERFSIRHICMSFHCNRIAWLNVINEILRNHKVLMYHCTYYIVCYIWIHCTMYTNYTYIHRIIVEESHEKKKCFSGFRYSVIFFDVFFYRHSKKTHRFFVVVVSKDIASSHVKCMVKITRYSWCELLVHFLETGFSDAFREKKIQIHTTERSNIIYTTIQWKENWCYFKWIMK